MTKVRDVIVKHHKIVPFPWTIRKIKKAGYSPTEFLLRMGKELAACDDADSETARAVLANLKELEMML